MKKNIDNYFSNRHIDKNCINKYCSFNGKLVPHFKDDNKKPYYILQTKIVSTGLNNEVTQSFNLSELLDMIFINDYSSFISMDITTSIDKSSTILGRLYKDYNNSYYIEIADGYTFKLENYLEANIGTLMFIEVGHNIELTEEMRGRIYYDKQS